MPTAESTVVSVDGHRIRLTHLDTVLYPETGTTKADVLDYYARVADALVRHAAHRPVTRKRWVHGVGTTQHPLPSFFQKNLDDSTPDWVVRRSITHRDHVNEYPLVDRASLTWFAQTSALELHVPQWQFGRTGTRKNPDRLVLDLDPGEGTGLAECAEVARLARAILEDMGLAPFPVTSGSTGIHVYAALDGKLDSDAVKSVAHELARALEADHPDLVVSEMKKTRRSGRVLVDWSQNSAAKTTIAPYSLRGRARPFVAAPRTWRELASPKLAHLEYTEVLSRLEKRGDVLEGLAAGHLASREPTAQRLAGFSVTPESRDRLEAYRLKRDSSTTPEPVPPGIAPTSDGTSFVIQEHHARGLHWDFRLEHDGVLVSWALPKGVPTDRRRNHLAVQTEDHPLDYGTFEGTIPAGEYGAGEVTIWDSGEFELEKWREGKDIIVTLHSERRGSRRFALIHTNDDDWLIHLMEADVPVTVDDRAADPDSSAGAPGRSSDGGSTRGKSADEGSADGQPSDGQAAAGQAADGDAAGHLRQARGSRFARRLPQISPMLASAGQSDTLSRGEWAFEMKWDGIRAIARIDRRTVTITSRNGHDLTATYPELQILAAAVDGDAVLDGEIVVLNAAGRPDFGLLQQRMGLTRPRDAEAAATRTPARFIAFDLLERRGTSTIRRGWSQRRELLEAAVLPRSELSVSPVFLGDLEAATARSLELGLEGVMAKKRDSTYSPGRRSRSWVKLKHHRTQEVVVAGWRPGKGNREGRIGSLLLGVHDGEALCYVGRVGTGFRDRELDELARLVEGLERETPALDGVPPVDAADAHWLTPCIVGEVEFSDWTIAGRLRHPTWRGLRPDKQATEIEREPS